MYKTAWWNTLGTVAIVSKRRIAEENKDVTFTFICDMLEEEGFQVKDMSHLLGISHDKVTRANWEKDIKNITRQTGKKTLKIKI